MVLNKLLFLSLILACGAIPSSYSMIDGIPILSSSDGSVIPKAKFFKIHKKESCETYTISKFITSSDCKQSHSIEFKKQLWDSKNTHVITYHDASWYMIAMVPMGKLNVSDEPGLRLHAQKRLDPAFKPKAVTAIIQLSDQTITFYDAEKQELLCLSYNGSSDIGNTDLAKFKKYLNLDNVKIIEEDLENIRLDVDDQTNLTGGFRNNDNSDMCCILF